MLVFVVSVVFACTILGTVLGAVHYKHVSTFPCDVSMTGATKPEYYLFSVGMSSGAALMFWLFWLHDSGLPFVLGTTGCIGCSGLSIFDTTNYFKTHSVFALTCFLSFLSYIGVTTGPTESWSPFLLVGVVCYGFRILTAAIATGQWDVFNAKHERTGAIRFLSFLKFRSVCQWITIFCLFAAILTRFSSLDSRVLPLLRH